LAVAAAAAAESKQGGSAAEAEDAHERFAARVIALLVELLEEGVEARSFEEQLRRWRYHEHPSGNGDIGGQTSSKAFADSAFRVNSLLMEYLQAVRAQVSFARSLAHGCLSFGRCGC
jgi:hypothetical protein